VKPPGLTHVVLLRDSDLGAKGDVVAVPAKRALSAIAAGKARGAMLAEIVKFQELNTDRVVRKGA
jgi:hypothetical protein